MEPSYANPKVIRTRIIVSLMITGLLATTLPVQAGDCPPNMLAVEDFCIDTFEAPNQAGALPLVMYTYHEATAWCAQRAKRLCFDDEWTQACGGAAQSTYPYGNKHMAGVCNDEETWIAYNQSLLDAWPTDVSTPDITSLQQLLDAARASSSSGADSANHVEFLYQGEPSGDNTGCVSPDGILDLCGNIEEWTQRRTSGGAGFDGNLKGRYWAESRTCQQAILSHGNGFRFYQLGFRCCSDQISNPGFYYDGFEELQSE